MHTQNPANMHFFSCSISLHQKPLTLTAPVEGERGHQGYICATVSTLCVIRDVSTKADSYQVTDQMHSYSLLNYIFSTFLVFLYS